jgi:hypothetical protein
MHFRGGGVDKRMYSEFCLSIPSGDVVFGCFQHVYNIRWGVGKVYFIVKCSQRDNRVYECSQSDDSRGVVRVMALSLVSYYCLTSSDAWHIYVSYTSLVWYMWWRGPIEAIGPRFWAYVWAVFATGGPIGLWNRNHTPAGSGPGGSG